MLFGTSAKLHTHIFFQEVATVFSCIMPSMLRGSPMRVLILTKIIVTTARHPLRSSGMSAQPASPKLLIDELPVLQASGLLQSNVRARKHA